MYGITATSYRAIASPADLQTGETAAATVPQSLIDSIAAAQAAKDGNAATLLA